MLDDSGIQFYASQNEDIKTSGVERFNCTLKTKMWKYFTHCNTFKFVDVLQDMVLSYNRTHHSTIGRAPIDVNAENATEVYKRMYGDTSRQRRVELNLQVGQKVRISKTCRTFEQGYLPNWTEEIFRMSKVIDTDPPTYKIVDYDGEPVEGSFYYRELQRIIKADDVFKIEEIIRTRRRRGTAGTVYFVKWRKYPYKFNSWVDEADVMNVI